MFIYLCERLLRFIRYVQKVTYRKVSVSCGKTLHLALKRNIYTFSKLLYPKHLKYR